MLPAAKGSCPDQGAGPIIERECAIHACPYFQAIRKNIFPDDYGGVLRRFKADMPDFAVTDSAIQILLTDAVKVQTLRYIMICKIVPA